MKLVAPGLALLSSVILTCAPAPARAAAPSDFTHQIAPVFKEYCAECHAGAKKKGGLSMNTRESLLEGGENGPVVLPGKPDESTLLKHLLSQDPEEQMPPKGPRVPPEKIRAIREWIAAGAVWEPGVSLAKSGYEPPLAPRRPKLPAATQGRNHPIDRLLDADLARSQRPLPKPVGDGVFLRRVHLDLIGLLPTPAELTSFQRDRSPDKRAKKVRELLARDIDYTEHWLTFWNDLLRNDYDGTGFITGGRKQITPWLYAALVTNKPFDQFTRELINPTAESEGFANGIKWRGEVSAGQTVEIQFSQSVSQSFLGINMKCASCHDSFVDRWKLDDAYGLAAIYSERPLEIHRCDKPTGRMAVAAWMFPTLGQVATNAPRAQRLQQLAQLLTHPENGRLTRTIVNRLWHRLMGRGLVHPVDAMDTEPWNADLLDHLASHLHDHAYDLKQTLELIATSQAYQSHSEITRPPRADSAYAYAGPRARRLTAEQFVDAVWQLTGAAPSKFDAPVRRTKPDATAPNGIRVSGAWIWGGGLEGGRTISLRRTWELATAPTNAIAVISVDNEYELFVNGTRVLADKNWETLESTDLTKLLRTGSNELVIVATNGGSDPNPAGAFLQIRALLPDGSAVNFGTDTTWTWVQAKPDGQGRFPATDLAWAPAQAASGPWADKLAGEVKDQLSKSAAGPQRMVRAGLLKSDFLQRSLGRPNRDQIVSLRPNDLTTLEAIDLANGPILFDTLARGSEKLLARPWTSPREFVNWIYRFALSREPTGAELSVALEMLGPSLNAQGIEDVLWAATMLPEFHIVR